MLIKVLLQKVFKQIEVSKYLQNWKVPDVDSRGKITKSPYLPKSPRYLKIKQKCSTNTVNAIG